MAMLRCAGGRWLCRLRSASTYCSPVIYRTALAARDRVRLRPAWLPATLSSSLAVPGEEPPVDAAPRAVLVADGLTLEVVGIASRASLSAAKSAGSRAQDWHPTSIALELAVALASSMPRSGPAKHTLRRCGAYSNALAYFCLRFSDGPCLASTSNGDVMSSSAPGRSAAPWAAEWLGGTAAHTSASRNRNAKRNRRCPCPDDSGRRRFTKQDKTP